MINPSDRQTMWVNVSCNLVDAWGDEVTVGYKACGNTDLFTVAGAGTHNRAL